MDASSDSSESSNVPARSEAFSPAAIGTIEGKQAVVFSRRELLIGSAVAAAAWATGCGSRSRNSLSGSRMQTLAVICDQIIPADDCPSASEAGVLTFIERQLGRHYRPFRNTYFDGLALTERISRERYGVLPAGASAAQQFDLVTALEKQAPVFFELVRRHTLQGYYGSPRHGGNRDAVSWRMLGLDEPPVRGRARYDLTAGRAK